jgi:septum formation protein
VNRLVLASGSASRARLLRAAAVPFEIHPADIDEETIKKGLLAAGKDAAFVAQALAEQKANHVSRLFPQAIVLGCDQILLFNGRLIAKSVDLAAAKILLKQLAGHTHFLLTASVLASNGAVFWRLVERCTMRMRTIDDEFLDRYLAAEGTDILSSVGCYHLEGRGAQLFEAVEGDYFSILGLPLLSVLAALRDHEVMARGTLPDRQNLQAS